MTIYEILRDAETNYKQGTTSLGEYVQWSMRETIERTIAYLNSKHITGDKDSLGRDKPFYNIVSSAVNIWYRATDLDRKDIVVIPSKTTDVGLAFVATVHLQEWMKKARFGVFLNQWGRTLAQFGSAVVKFIEQDGELFATVVPWSRMIVDPVDFNAIPKIEKFYLTPAQLRKKEEYNKEMVEKLIKEAGKRETIAGQVVDNQDGFIEIYEIHGELSQEVYNNSKGAEVKEGDANIYFQQMHVVSYIENSKGEFIDFTLYSGKESKDPYMITHLIPEEGRTLAIGAVEYLFDSQWMQNHVIKNMKDQLDITSRIMFQTSDQRFVGRNVLTNVESGAILSHDLNKPLTQVNSVGHDITSLKLFADQWKVLEREITSTPDAARGTTPPSGTPYSTTALLTSQGLSLFELMTENKGHAVEDMLRTHIIPHLKKKMDTADEISATLEERDIHKLDSMYVPREAIRRFNKRLVGQVIEMGDNQNEQVLSPFVPQNEQQLVRQELGQLGNQRFFKPSEVANTTWKKALKDLEWNLDVGITNEQHDKSVILQSLSTTFQTLASLAGRPMTPDEKLIFNKIMTQTGSVSPVELSAV